MIRPVKPNMRQAFLCSTLLVLMLGMIAAVPDGSSASLAINQTENLGTTEKDHQMSPTSLSQLTNGAEENETSTSYTVPVNLTTMLAFLDRMFNSSANLHSDQPDVHASLVATYQVAFIARVLGLNHFKAVENAQGIANLTAEQDLGFRINEETEDASIAATFGALNTLYMLDAMDLVNLTGVRNFLGSRYNSTTGTFNDLGRTGPLLDTYRGVQANQYLETSIITSVRVDEIVGYLNSSWSSDGGYFHDSEAKINLFVQNWIAVSLIEELNKTKAVQVNETEFAGYPEQLSNWITTNYNESLENGTLTVSDACAAILTLQKMNRSEVAGINTTQFIEFIVSSQRTETDDVRLEGGFADSPTADNETISVTNSFMAVQGIIAVGRYFENLSMILSTGFGLKEDLPQHVIQGDNETISLSYTLFNSSLPDVDYLKIRLVVDNDEDNLIWNISEPEYSSKSTYSSIIYFSSNWSLGNHTVKAFTNLDRIPFVSLTDHVFDEYITVTYDIQVTTNATTYIRPTRGVQMDLRIMNCSATTHEIYNITESDVNITIRYPIDGVYRNLTNALHWNGTAIVENDTRLFPLENDGITTINFSIPNRVALGDYLVRIANVTDDRTLSEFNVRVYVPTLEFQILAFNDTINHCITRNQTTLTPGKEFSLNTTMKYTLTELRMPNGTLNASFVMTSTINDSLSFTIPLEFSEDVNETTIYRTLENQTVPLRPLMGNYSVAVVFTWNISNGYMTSPIENPSMPLVYVGGTPVGLNATITSVVGNLTAGPVTVYYGEEVNASLEIGINESRISLLEDLDVEVFIWNMTGGTIEEMNPQNQTDAMLPFTTLIDPNTPHGDFQIAVQLTLPHNATMVNITQFYLPKSSNPMAASEYRFALAGDLEIPEGSIEYITANEENVTAIDEFPVFAATFRVLCPQSGELITGLDLYGQLVLVGEENVTVSLPDVGFTKEDKYYQVWVRVDDIPIGEYELTLYTHTAIAADTAIGSIPLELVDTIKPPPEEEEIEWPVITAAVLVLLTLVLLVWNLRLGGFKP